MATSTAIKAAKSTPSQGSATNDQVKQFILTNFPSYAFVLNVPELYSLFQKAIVPGTGTNSGTLQESSTELVSQLEASNWWQTHGQSVRNYMNQSYTDPDTQAEQVQAKDADVHQMANKLGLADNQVNIDQMARNAIMYGWDDNELQEQLASQATFNKDAPTTSNLGTIDDSIAQLKANAANYMVSWDNQTYFNWARDISAGHHTVDDYTPLMIDAAKGRFPTLASTIDGGVTPQQYFTPIASMASKLLEKTITTGDLTNDPTYSKIISYTDPKTGAPRPMNESEAQSYIRSTDAWKGTAQGQQSAADFTEGLLQMFGKRGGSAPSGISGPANAF